MPLVLLLTGPAGSGKTTISRLIGQTPGWERICEDDVWPRLFGRNRGAFGSHEHRQKRAAVHARVFEEVRNAIASRRNVVIDATVHESPPESFEEYRCFFSSEGIAWAVRVLYPRVDVAIARDAARTGWHLGARNVAALHAKFTGEVFPSPTVIDNSEEPLAHTVARVLASVGVATLSRPVQPK